MAEQPRPLDRDALRARYKQDKAELEAARAVEFDKNVTRKVVRLLEKVNAVKPVGRTKAGEPAVVFHMGEQDMAIEAKNRLALLNCDTELRERCICGGNHLACQLVLTAVPFWETDSPIPKPVPPPDTNTFKKIGVTSNLFGTETEIFTATRSGCPRCGTNSLLFIDRTRNGSYGYQCNDCKKQFLLNYTWDKPGISPPSCTSEFKQIGITTDLAGNETEIFVATRLGCPHCGSDSLSVPITENGSFRYKCNDCERKFILRNKNERAVRNYE